MEETVMVDSPVGILRLKANEKGLQSVDMLGTKQKPSLATPKNMHLRKTIKQLREYFKGKRTEFDVPLATEGTDFQKKVWSALQQIPFGETASYGEVAKKIGKPKAARAVGGANNKNPVGIIVPCHRVIGSSGQLVGYAAGTKIKEKLLKLERRGSYK